MKPTDLPPRAIDRRRFVAGLAAAWPAAWLAGGLGGGALAEVAATGDAPASFMSRSRLLTGHDEIRDEVAPLAWAALSRRHPDFDDRYRKLDAALDRDGVDGFAAIASSGPMSDPALKETAMAIIGAWYLGRVGKVEVFSETASTFVTFADALMWAPTVDVTVVPTYSRAGPGHWAEPPKGVTPR